MQSNGNGHPPRMRYEGEEIDRIIGFANEAVPLH